jgi:hypothetical protein
MDTSAASRIEVFRLRAKKLARCLVKAGVDIETG